MFASIPLADYTTGGSILTFAIPMLLIIIVAGTLYSVFLGTRYVPGHQVNTVGGTPGPTVTAAVSETATSAEDDGAAPSA